MRSLTIYLFALSMMLMSCLSEDNAIVDEDATEVEEEGINTEDDEENADENEESTDENEEYDDGEWLIPLNEVRDGGPGKDGIPALENPNMIRAHQVDFLNDDDLVVGVVSGGSAKAYSHKILDWHEIANDDIGGNSIAVIYCPLTGTAMCWEREQTTFGVSGLLYNANVIPFDRATGSNWIQIGLTCVNGQKIGEKPKTYPVVETTWKTWRLLYPSTEVMSLNTGYSRNYNQYPYGNYKTEGGLLFSVSIDDTSLHRKERVHGMIIEEKVKAYRLSHFPAGTPLITDVFNGQEVIVVGSEAQNVIVSFQQKVIDGQKLVFSTPSDIYANGSFLSAVILEDQLGNQWDISGNAISGPNQGEQMTPTVSLMGYWFSWASFYGVPEIYEPG